MSMRWSGKAAELDVLEGVLRFFHAGVGGCLAAEKVSRELRESERHISSGVQGSMQMADAWRHGWVDGWKDVENSNVPLVHMWACDGWMWNWWHARHSLVRRKVGAMGMSASACTCVLVWWLSEFWRGGAGLGKCSWMSVITT